MLVFIGFSPSERRSTSRSHPGGGQSHISVLDVRQIISISCSSGSGDETKKLERAVSTGLGQVDTGLPTGLPMLVQVDLQGC